MSLRPWFSSEVGVTGAISKACGVSAGDAGTMVATDNEANLNKYGRFIGKKGRESRLKRGWRAFANQKPPDPNGWMDQGDVRLVHAAMHPDLPFPAITSTKDAGWVWDRIGANAIAIAILPHAAGSGDAIARYVGNVPHKGTAVAKRVKAGVRQVRWICPMHPPSDTYFGHWVKWTSLKKCAMAVPTNIGAAAGRTWFVELYPAGAWTKAELYTDSRQKRIRQLVKDLDHMTERRDALREKADGLAQDLIDCGIQVGQLKEALEDCESGADDSAISALLDELHDWEQEHRP